MWQKLLWLMLAGGLGTLARYTVAGWVQRGAGGAYPWGTLAVNAGGCFLFGLIWSLAEGRLALTPQTRLLVLTGFLGAFTTFSTYAFETSQMLRDGQWLAAGANFTAQNVLGFIMVMAGFALGRLW